MASCVSHCSFHSWVQFLVGYGLTTAEVAFGMGSQRKWCPHDRVMECSCLACPMGPLDWAAWFALFAIGGNIITAWSWFGTNQLGIGLHSYGFTSGVLMLLGGYVLSQLVLIALGLFLTRKELVQA